MQVLFEGLYSKFDNDASLKAVVSGMYFTQAPQGTEYPYITYHKISDRPDYTYTEDMENVIIQFNIYDDHYSSTTINDIYSKLTALYDWCSLNVTGWDSIYMRRELDNLTRENDIWQYMIQYRLAIQQ